MIIIEEPLIELIKKRPGIIEISGLPDSGVTSGGIKLIQKMIAEEDLCASDIVQYICNLESYISRLKEIHWSATDDKTHTLSDNMRFDLSSTQDEHSEIYMGLTGKKFNIGFLSNACSTNAKTLPELLTELQTDTIQMYNVMHDNYEFKGIESVLNRLLGTIDANLYKYTVYIG